MPTLEVIGGTRDVNATLDYCMKEKVKDPETKELVNKCVLKAGVNCDIDDIHSDFQETRDFFEKDDGRQGMHLTASFSSKELSVDRLSDHEKCLQIGVEVAEKIAKGHEAGVFVHIDRNHLHCHIVLNSVNFETGKKYHMEKNKDLVIIRNQFDQICEKNGVKPLETYKGQSVVEKNAEKRIKGRGQVPWKQEIRDAIGYAKENAHSFEQYKQLLLEKGVEYYERGEKTKGYVHLATQEAGNPKCRIRERNKALDGGYHLADVMKQIEANKQGSTVSKEEKQSEVKESPKTPVNAKNSPSVSLPVPVSDDFEETIKDSQEKKQDIKENAGQQLQEAEDEAERIAIKKKEEIELEQADIDKEIKLKDDQFYQEMLLLFQNIERSNSRSSKKYENKGEMATLELKDMRANQYEFTCSNDSGNSTSLSIRKKAPKQKEWEITAMQFIHSEEDLEDSKELVEDVVNDVELQNKRYEQLRNRQLER